MIIVFKDFSHCICVVLRYVHHVVWMLKGGWGVGGLKYMCVRFFILSLTTACPIVALIQVIVFYNITYTTVTVVLQEVCFNPPKERGDDPFSALHFGKLYTVKPGN